MTGQPLCGSGCEPQRDGTGNSWRCKLPGREPIVAEQASARVGHAAGHMPGRHVPCGRVDMAGLVVKEEVGLELAQEFAFGQPTQEHGFVHIDVPVHQRADGALVGRCAAGGDQCGADAHGRRATLLQAVQGRAETLPSK